MQGIVETIQAGEQISEGQSREVGKMFEEFMQTDIYKILAAFNVNEIKRLASMDDDRHAERTMGKIIGIQDGFENRIKAIILQAQMDISQKKLEKQYKKEASLEEGGEPKAENIPTARDEGL